MISMLGARYDSKSGLHRRVHILIAEQLVFEDRYIVDLARVTNAG